MRINRIFSIFFLCLICHSLQAYFYKVEDIFIYFDEKRLEDYQNQAILGNLSTIFENSYAFYDISKNPPNTNYYTKVDIQERLSSKDFKDLNYYQFYQKVTKALYDLKDTHI